MGGVWIQLAGYLLDLLEIYSRMASLREICIHWKEVAPHQGDLPLE